MIKFLVKGQNIETLEHEVIASDQISFVKIHFVFDNNWKALHKVVQFSQEENTYSRVLGVDGTSCFLPSELESGAVKMSLFGYDAHSSETVRATTIIKMLNIRPSGFDGENSNVPPTPDLYQQLLQKISEKGSNGKSAFEIALEHGFVGIWESVFTAVSEKVNAVNNVITTVWNAVSLAISNVMNTIFDTVSSVWNNIYEVISPLLDAFKYLFETIFEAIKVLIGRAMDWISEKIQNIWNSIVSFITPLLEGIKKTFQIIWNGISSTIFFVLE